MKEKMRKVRYPMLIVWGIFMGAAGTAGGASGAAGNSAVGAA